MRSLRSKAEYLAKAKEAELQQNQARDPIVRDSWERIVVGYLELADLVDQRDRLHCMILDRAGPTIDE